MNAAAALHEAFVLRVLAGRQKGADYRLPPGKFVRLGYAFDHDVVLRDGSTRGLSLELHLGEDIACVRMIAGNAVLLGRPIGPGEEAALPPFVPLHLGALAIAIGSAQSARWRDAERLLHALPAAVEDPTLKAERADPVERVATRLYPLRGAVAIGRRWPAYAMMAGMLALGAVAATPAISWIEDRYAGSKATQALLAANGYPDLAVAQGETGDGPLISGIVRDDAELARLRQFVSEQIGPAIIDVDTMQAMAAAATDILLAQGIDAEARAMRGRTLLVSSEFLPVDRQDELAALIRRDVPGIVRVAFRATPGRGDRDLQYFFSGSAYGLATFVDGTPGHIVTADGTHWFAGAQVPTGHRIIAIGNGRASFERDGRVEELVLGPAGPPAMPAQSPIKPAAMEGRIPS